MKDKFQARKITRPLQLFFWVAGVCALIMLSACTVVPIEEAEQAQAAKQFDAVGYVEANWEKVTQTVDKNGAELSTVLSAIEADAAGVATKTTLKKVADQYGLTTVGEAHVFMIKGSGTITAVDTSSRTGTATLTVDGYTGPIAVKIYIGKSIPSSETALRDAVGFISFGDFKEQTEYGKAARELNKRAMNEALSGVDTKTLTGKTVSLEGAFSVPTFNKPEQIDVSEIVITPVQFNVGG